MKYVVALEVLNETPCTFIAPWVGDPGRTCVEENAKRYDSVQSATFGLAHARKHSDFVSATILEVTK